MIVLDTSAVVALLQEEAEAPEIARAMADADGCLLSAVSYLESAMVLIGRTGVGAVDDLDALIDQAGVEVVPFDRPQSKLAREAFLRFGKGRHPAALNFGDCASYALASGRALPLLFKGNDFTQSDIAFVRIK